MSSLKVAVDWPWVKKELLDREKIGSKKDAFPILECVNACLEKAASISSPRIVSCEKKIAALRSGSIEVEGKITLSGKSLSSYLKDSESICIFLVTIGDYIENTASRLMEGGEALQGYLLDRIGSFAVESLAQNFEERLREDYSRKEKSVSMRFSPGYCDWAVEEQLKLDRLIDFSKAGVRLTESCMMVPKKSISAITGIGPEGLFPQDRKSPCCICNQKDCDWRRTA